MKKEYKEVDVAAPVITWLEDKGWDVYQEVDNCDIVALMGPIVWVLEVKTSMSLQLCAQAWDRRWIAHHISIVIPKKKMSNGANWAMFRLVEEGIGIIVVDMNKNGLVRERFKPKLIRRPSHADNLRKCCFPSNKHFSKAGSPSSNRWTPWKETCLRIRKEVDNNPGIELKDLLNKFSNFHYRSESSARSALSYQIRHGVFKEVRLVKDGKKLRLFSQKERNDT